MNTTVATLTTVIAALGFAGCIQVKTENEIKPIHITMDVNLKVDRELDRQFDAEQKNQAKGDYAAVKKLLESKAAGLDNRAMLVARDSATDDERIEIVNLNARRIQRFNSVAKNSGATLATAQTRHAAKMREKMSAGTWYQDDSGLWKQK